MRDSKEELKFWVDLYRRLSQIDSEAQSAIFDLINTTKEECSGMLETVPVEYIDSVREYMKWLNALKDNIEFAEDRWAKLSKEKQVNKLLAPNLRKIFRRKDGDTDMASLNRLRAGLTLQPH
jgi:hypothetical protein